MIDAIKLWQEIGTDSDKPVDEFQVRWHGLNLETRGHISVAECDAITLNRDGIVAWHNENAEYLLEESKQLALVAASEDAMGDDYRYLNGMM